MAAVLFVHGTGVRRGSYLATFALIQQAFHRYEIRHELQPCLWGDDLGATPAVKSLPELIDEPKDPRALTRDQEYARWELLYRDPLFELRLLKNRPLGGPRAPGLQEKGAALWKRITEYHPSADVRDRLRCADLEDCYSAAWKTVIIDDPTGKEAIDSAPEIGEPGQAIARAVVAEMLVVAFNRDLPLLDGRSRDALVDRLVDEWGARVAGIGAFLLRFFGDMVASVATPIVKAKRGSVSEASTPAAGDILRYQARGELIRDYIRASIGRTEGDVFLLAHSLGGIACVDLLAERTIDRVKGLITVGSQAPYLHEIGALRGLTPGTTELPAGFPPWLNLYDPYDFLSYLGARVFPSGVKDYRITSDQPFPQSHSAYWTNAETWTAVRAFLS